MTLAQVRGVKRKRPRMVRGRFKSRLSILQTSARRFVSRVFRLAQGFLSGSGDLIGRPFSLQALVADSLAGRLLYRRLGAPA